MNATLAVLLLPMVSFAQHYKAEQVVDHDVPVVGLIDAAHGVEVSVAATESFAGKRDLSGARGSARERGGSR